MTTIGESLARIRGVIKAHKQDAFITDRFLYSLVIKFGKGLIKREDNRNLLMRYNSLFKPLPCVELIEVDSIEACCSDVRTGCTFRRTKEKLPGLLEGTYGALFRTVSSIDGSVPMFETDPSTYGSMTRIPLFRYNSNKYFWYLDGHLYFPNIEWEAVRVEGMFEEAIGEFSCDEEAACSLRQDSEIAIPEYLFPEIEGMVLKELGFQASLPGDGATDKQNISRS